MKQATRADWYFDFVSPFSWLALNRLDALRAECDLRPRPVLFAGLLKHWGQKGPAEISPKRVWTYRWCLWCAERDGIAFRLPAAHPFNPLPYLRLALAAGATWPGVTAIFETLWTTGADPADSAVVEDLAERLSVAPERLAAPEIKNGLRETTEQAAAAGVFGVPSLVVDGRVFWGADAHDFALACVRNPGLLGAPAMRAAGDLPVAASRRDKGY